VRPGQAADALPLPILEEAVVTFRLVIDPIRCDAFGYCAELAPEFLHLDEWGYPVLEREVTSKDRDLVATIVKACPRRALVVLEDPPR
jgi:ferredoxin